MLKANIVIGKYKFKIKFLNTKTANKIYESLPIVANVNFWGDEIYFFTSLNIDLEENAKDIITMGELAYWPNGNAIAIGFGPTPISRSDEIRLADKCNIWGKTDFNLTKLRTIKNQEKITISI